MLFDRRNGQTHVTRYLGHGFFVNATRDEDTAALIRQIIENALHPPQFVARAKLSFAVEA